MFKIAYNRIKQMSLESPYTKQVPESRAPKETNGDNGGMSTRISRPTGRPKPATISLY